MYSIGEYVALLFIGIVIPFALMKTILIMIEDKHKKWIFIVCSVLTIVYILLLIPKNFNHTYNGVKYRLGKENTDI